MASSQTLRALFRSLLPGYSQNLSREHDIGFRRHISLIVSLLAFRLVPVSLAETQLCLIKLEVEAPIRGNLFGFEKFFEQLFGFLVTDRSTARM